MTHVEHTNICDRYLRDMQRGFITAGKVLPAWNEYFLLCWSWGIPPSAVFKLCSSVDFPGGNLT